MASFIGGKTPSKKNLKPTGSWRMESTTKLQETLEGVGLDVEREGGGFRVERPFGDDDPVEFDAEPFLQELSKEGTPTPRDLSAYAAGVRHVLLEPSGSNARDLGFTEVAGDISLALHAEPFVHGARAAAGREAWSSTLVDDLRFVCLIELDRGTRVLTRDQFERWSATTDRLISGARSMLFHKAQQTASELVEDREPVEKLDVGDGYDAARILVLDDLMFGEFDESSRFAMPSPGDLYFVREGTPSAVDRLREAIEKRIADCDYPLSSRLFRLERGRPKPMGGDS